LSGHPPLSSFETITMSSFADNVLVKSYTGTFARKLSSLGLSARDVDAISREVRAEAGPEGAIVSERQDGSAVPGLAEHWRHLSGALRKAEQDRDKDLEATEEQEDADADAGGFEDKEREFDTTEPTAKAQRLKELRHRYQKRQPKKSIPSKVKSKAKSRTVTGTKAHDCSCGGQCGSCSFDRCTQLGEQLTKLDLAISLADNEIQVAEIARATKQAFIIDEASRVTDDLYATIRPMLAVSQGSLIAMSTPWGRAGWWFAAWHSDEPWERVFITAEQCPRISAEFLTEEKKAMPERFFRQEFFGEFLDTLDQVFRSEDLELLAVNAPPPLWS
jgi:hypothetical protein